MNDKKSSGTGPTTGISRWKFLKISSMMAGAGCLGTLGLSASLAEQLEPVPRYQIGVCDWMILKRQKISAFPLADKIGVDGVEVDMGGLGDRKTFDSKLGDPATRRQFLDKAASLNLDICSIAMSGFYAQSFARRPTYMRMVQDCIDTMAAMDVKVAFLPLGVPSNLVKHPDLRPAIVKRLQDVARRAEGAGVIIGVETTLSAAEEVRLFKDIGSSAIQSYFNFENPLEGGRDLCNELRTLGKEHICQIHCTDKDKVILRENKRIDMPKVKRTLDEMGWSGWLVLERSRDADHPHDIMENYGANATYMKSIFQEG